MRTLLITIIVNLSIVMGICQDEAISFDTTDIIFSINAKQAEKLKITCNLGVINNVQLYRQSDTTYYYEIHYTANNKNFKQRVNISKSGLVDLRYRYSQISNISPQVNYSDTSDMYEGRGLMLASCTYFGLTLYGATLPVVVESTDPRTNVGLYMLGAGSSFFIPWLSTRNLPVSYGQANLVNYGLSRGYLHGALLSLSFNYKNEASANMGIGAIMGIGEAYAGYQMVRKYNISNGTANLITVCGDYGLYAGVGLAVQLRMFEASSTIQSATSTILLGGLAGLYSGYCLGKDNNISTGDAEIISTTGMLGGFLPLIYSSYIQSSDIRMYITPSVIGGVIGLYAGYQLSKNTNFTFSQGLVTKIGTVAGGLTGLGMAYIFNAQKGWQYMAGTYIGAQLSFLALHNFYKLRNDNALSGNLKFTFTPQNYLLAKTMKANPIYANAFPLASLYYRF